MSPATAGLFYEVAFMDEYIKIGKLVASHGVGGDLILHHSLDNKKLKNLEFIFIEHVSQSFIPYFVEKSVVKNNTDLIVKLEGIQSKEEAAKIFPKDVWLKAADFRQMVGKSAPIALIGYHVIDNKTDLGEVIEIIEQPHQVLCAILYQGKEVLIPLHAETLEKIDHKSRQLFVKLPEGLLDIYL